MQNIYNESFSIKIIVSFLKISFTKRKVLHFPSEKKSTNIVLYLNYNFIWAFYKDILS